MFKFMVRCFLHNFSSVKGPYTEIYTLVQHLALVMVDYITVGRWFTQQSCTNREPFRQHKENFTVILTDQSL